jgi:hypothetical protein
VRCLTKRFRGNAESHGAAWIGGRRLARSSTNAVSARTCSPPLWDGLAVLHEAFVPHYRSPGHPETAAIEQVVTRYRAEGIAYRTLRDGQALLVNGPHTKIV